MTAQFRIGGVYRDGRGSLCGVFRHLLPSRIAVRFVDEADAEISGMAFDHDARTGEYLDPAGKPVASSRFNLVPGELTLVNGEWVPVAEEAPKAASTKDQLIYCAIVDAYFGSKAQVSPPPKPAETPPFSVRVGATEKKRPALTWATPKPFDAFKGFFTEPADIADWQDTYFPR